MTKNAVPDKYSYSVYDIGFDARIKFSLPDGSGVGKNVIIVLLRMPAIERKILITW